MTSKPNPQNVTFKAIILGESGVGKSCLLNRFLKDKFDSEYQATVGCEFAKSEFKLGEKQVFMQIWDTAGQETFRSIIKNLYSRSSICFLVFNLTDRKSLEKLNFWFKEAKENCPSTCLFVLVGAQADRVDQRQVTAEQAKAFMAEKKMQDYLQTSSKESTGVRQLFYDGCKRAYQQYLQKDVKQTVASSQAHKLAEEKTNKKKCC